MPIGDDYFAPDFDLIAQGNHEETANAMNLIYQTLNEEVSIRQRQISNKANEARQDRVVLMGVYGA